MRRLTPSIHHLVFAVALVLWAGPPARAGEDARIPRAMDLNAPADADRRPDAADTDGGAGDFGFDLDLDAPRLAGAEETPRQGLVTASLGDFASLNFGGLLDERWVAVGNDPGGLVIHVNELVVTTNIGDHVSLLAEQLLPTSEIRSLVADDHGFAYGILTNLPFLPSGAALKVGRFRGRYGIDAKIDSPATPIYPLVRKNLGFISDRGVELSGFWRTFEYNLAVMNGPDNLRNVGVDAAGRPVDLGRLPIDNGSKPVLLRLGWEVTRSLQLGLSGFLGRSYPFFNDRQPLVSFQGYGLTGGALDKGQLIHKKRGSLDVLWRTAGIDIFGEFTLGKDDYDSRQGIGTFNPGFKHTVRGYYLRAEVPLSAGKLSAGLQFDRWEDGLDSTRDGVAWSAGLTYHVSDSVLLRLADTYPTVSRDHQVSLQMYLPF